MYTSKDIAEAIEKIPTDDLDVTAIAWCDLHNRITRETGLSEEAVRQMMKKECLLWIRALLPLACNLQKESRRDGGSDH